MKKMFWLLPLTIVVTLGLSGSLIFAQDVAQLYTRGIEDLQNNLDAEAVESLEQAAEAAAVGSKELGQVRYALGYAYARQGQNGKAITVLDQLVADSPDSVNGRYLLGVSLIRRMGGDNVERGIEVLHQLAREKEGNVATIAMNASARLMHTQSTINYAAGDSGSALGSISDLLDRFGSNPAPTKSENQNIKFSAGVYLMASGDLDGAQFEFDYLALKAKDFSLANGTTLSEIRSNLYYEAALARLKEGGKVGGEGALGLMKQAEKLGGGNPAANHHLKALAYGLTGNTEEQAKSMAAVAAADPEYAARIMKK